MDYRTHRLTADQVKRRLPVWSGHRVCQSQSVVLTDSRTQRRWRQPQPQWAIPPTGRHRIVDLAVRPGRVLVELFTQFGDGVFGIGELAAGVGELVLQADDAVGGGEGVTLVELFA